MSNNNPVVYKTWDDGFSVRSMTKQDAKLVQRWYADICPTSCDLDVVLDCYPPEGHGFYIGEYRGEVVASAIRIPVCEGVYYGSLYYVKKAYRRLGFGKRLRDDVAAEHVGENMLCIDAHDDLEEMNKRHGYTTAFKVVLYSARVFDCMKGAHEFEHEEEVQVQPISSVDFQSILDYDNICFVKPNSELRKKMLEGWLRIANSKSVVALDKDGHVMGFGSRRPTSQSGVHIIGPLYADRFEGALAMMQALTDDIPSDTVLISICEPNGDARRLVQTLHLNADLHMLRMHLNGDPKEYNPRVFGLTSIDVCGF